MKIMCGLLACCLCIFAALRLWPRRRFRFSTSRHGHCDAGRGECDGGQQIQLVAATGILPGRVVTWSSSNAVVATVNSTGLVVKRQEVIAGRFESGHGCNASDALMRASQL